MTSVEDSDCHVCGRGAVASRRSFSRGRLSDDHGRRCGRWPDPRGRGNQLDHLLVRRLLRLVQLCGRASFVPAVRIGSGVLGPRRHLISDDGHGSRGMDLRTVIYSLRQNLRLRQPRRRTTPSGRGSGDFPTRRLRSTKNQRPQLLVLRQPEARTVLPRALPG